MGKNIHPGVQTKNTPTKGERYCAFMYFKGVIYNLGTFDTIEQAIEVRKKAEQEVKDGTLLFALDNKVRGVMVRQNKKNTVYRVQVQADKQLKYLGTFDKLQDAEDAATNYKNKKKPHN